MKRKIIVLIVATLSLANSLKADFSFNRFFKNMTEGITSMSSDANKTTHESIDVTVNISMATEKATIEASTDSKEATVELSHELNDIQVTTIKKVKSSLIEVTKDSKENIDTLTSSF